MFIVKSCQSQHNPMIGNTIRIGSMDEYRQTDKQEIADKGEATYSFNVHLTNAHIPEQLFKNLMHGTGTLTDCMVTKLDGPYQSVLKKDHVIIREMRGQTIWSGLNCLVFCMSCLDSPEEASDLFNSYDDYWYFDETNLQKIGELIRKQVEIKLKQDMLANGTSAGKALSKRFKCKLKIQKVTYSSRHINIRNNSTDERNLKFLSELIDNYRYLKPEKFSHEKEVRFIFECFDGEKLINHYIKSIIIDAKPIIPFIKSKSGQYRI
ncbi:MAG: hypothetical protein KIB40_12755 [Pantoea sp.]|uniref:Uncharacterized protein n=1 Tax=Pantoea brenneri TaxID=472694 RepID=A0AAX3JC29_9GAMM|nr:MULTISPECIES: hypothetical protein [Pantoea]MBS6033995.1 hypothetical protein [Pantoea sp.]VXC58797.1 conserved hypothetical protein [Pantoea brenneri]